MRFSVQSMTKCRYRELPPALPLRHTTFVSSWLENIYTIPFQDVKVLPVRSESSLAEDPLRCPTAVRLKPLSALTYKSTHDEQFCYYHQYLHQELFCSSFRRPIFQSLQIMFDMLTTCEKHFVFFFLKRTNSEVGRILSYFPQDVRVANSLFNVCDMKSTCP